MLLSNKTLTTALISVVAYATETQSAAESTTTYYDDYGYGDDYGDDYGYGDDDYGYGDDLGFGDDSYGGDSLDLLGGSGDAYDSYDDMYADDVYGSGDGDYAGADDYYGGDDIRGGDVPYYGGGEKPSAGGDDDRKDDDDGFRGRDYSDYLRGFKAFEPKASDVRRRPRPKTPFVPKDFGDLLNFEDFNNREALKQEMAERAPDGKSKFGVLDHEPKPHTSFHDFRDYDPYYYGVSPEERFADCVWPKNPFKLDHPDYNKLSAKCKEEVVWQNILMDETREGFFTGQAFQGLMDQDMNVTYDNISDSMPVRRVKRTHPVGTHTKVELIPHPDTPYTGMFRGSKHCMMRISETFEVTPEVPKTTPGHAVKCYRDGMYSGNFLAMFALDGQTSFNFFKNRWTTILREPNN